MSNYKVIGKGTFSTVYQISKKQVMYRTNDPVKFAIGEGWTPNSRLLPKIRYNKERELVAPLYPKLTAPKRQLNEKAFELYKQLREAFAIVSMGWSTITDWEYSNRLQEALESSGVSKHIRNLINETFDAIGNFTDRANIGFEISPRNLSYTKSGNLILLDCFFCRKTLTETRKRGH